MFLTIATNTNKNQFYLIFLIKLALKTVEKKAQRTKVIDLFKPSHSVFVHRHGFTKNLFIMRNKKNDRNQSLVRTKKLPSKKSNGKKVGYSLHDCLLPISQNEYVQIDHLVVNEYGIFVIETKNYYGKVTGKEQERYWQQTSNHHQHDFYNPIMQNRTHIEAIKYVLHDQTIPCFNMVVFTGKAKIHVLSDSIFNKKNFITHINKTREVQWTDEEQKKIILTIENAIEHDPTKRIEHDMNVANRYSKRVNRVSV